MSWFFQPLLTAANRLVGVSASITESASASDSSTDSKSSWGVLTEQSSGVSSTFYVDPISGNGPGFNASQLGNGNSLGITFVSKFTGQIGKIRFNVGAGFGTITPVTSGALEIWSRPNGLINGTGATLIASLPVFIRSLGSGNTTFDFSTTTCVLTSGSTYACLFRSGADWNNGISPGANDYVYSIEWYSSGSTPTAFNLLTSEYARVTTGTGTGTTSPYLPAVSIHPHTSIDSVGSAYVTSVSETESGTASDSPTGGLNIYKGEYEPISGDEAAEGYTNYLPSSGFTSLTAASGFRTGIHFIAPKTGRLGIIKADFYNQYSGTDSPVAIELWSLASNSVTAARQTLITQINTTTTTITNSSITNRKLLGDFSSNTSANVTAGTGYAVVIYCAAAMTGDIYAYGPSGDFLSLYRSTYGGGIVDTNYQIQMAVEYQNFNADSIAGGVLLNTDRTEAGSSADSASSNRLANNWILNTTGTYALHANSGFPTSYTSTLAIGIGYGATFIAPRTETITHVAASITVGGSGNIPSSNGAVELWQLASNSIDASPQTLLQSVPLKFTTSSAAASAPIEVNFNVTAGTGYAIVYKSATDWLNGAGNYFYNISVAVPDMGSSDSINTGNYIRQYSRSANWNGSTWLPISTYGALIDAYSVSTSDSDAGGLLLSRDVTEAGSSAETDSGIKTTFNGSYETTSTDRAVDSYSTKKFGDNYYGTLITSSNGRNGVTFLAPRTGRLGVVRSEVMWANNTDPIYIELWSLASNSLTATIQTLLATYTTSADKLYVDGNWNWSAIADFSNVTGADVTAGNGYAVVIRTTAVSTTHAIKTTAVYDPYLYVHRTVSNGVTYSGTVAGAFVLAVDYQNTDVDSVQGLFIKNGDETESVTSADAQDRTQLARSWASEMQLNALSGGFWSNGSSASPDFGGASGNTFIASRTETITDVLFKISLSGGGTNSSTLGAIELWQLASNSITALPNTKLQSVPIDQATFNYGAPVKVNFPVTAGVGYAIVFRTGTDWSSSGSFKSYYISTMYSSGPSDMPIYFAVASNYTRGVVQPASSAWASASSNIYLLDAYASNAIDGDVGSLIAPVQDTETATSAESNVANYVTFNSSSETSSGADANSAVNSSNTSSVEGVSSTDFPNSTRDANNWIVDGTYAVNAYAGFRFPGSAGIDSGKASGIRFVAPRTETITHVRAAITVVGSGSAPTSTGTVELWQLSSNDINGTPTTMLQSVPLVFKSTSVEASLPIQVNFNVTAGVGYAIAYKSAADWSTTGMLWYAIGQQNGLNYLNDYNYTGLKYSGTVFNGSAWGWMYAHGIDAYVLNTADNLVGGFTSTSTLTETSTPTEAQVQQLTRSSSSTETVTSTESLSLTAYINNSISEAGSSGDSLSSVKSALGIESSDDAVVSIKSLNDVQSTAGDVTTSSSVVEAFIAPKNGTLGTLWFSGSRVGTGGVPTGLGSVEIWSLSADNIESGIPQTMLTSLPIDLSQVPTSQSILSFDFSASGVSLVSGKGYGVVFKSGSDWFFNSVRLNIRINLNAPSVGASPDETNLLLNLYRFRYGSVGSWSTVIYSGVLHLGLSYSNATDIGVGGFTATSALTETGTASETEDRLLAANRSLTETGTSSDTSSNLVVFVAANTETVTSADNVVNYLLAVASITETNTSSSVEGGGFLAVTTLTESGTASDSEDRTIFANRSITEAGTSNDTSTNIVSFVVSLSETGTSSDSVSDYLLAAVSLTETGSASDSENRSVSTGNQVTTETSTASDVQVNIITTNLSLTEAASGLDTQSNTAIFVTQVTETRTATTTETNTAIFAVTRNEAASATEIESSSALFDTYIQELGAGADVQFDRITTTQFAFENVTPDETSYNMLSAATFVTENDTVASDATDNSAVRVANLIETAFALDLSETQILFVAYLFESLVSSDAPSSVKITDSDVEEFIDSFDTTENFVIFLATIVEAGLFPIEDVRGDTGNSQDEAAAANDESFRVIARPADATEYVEPSVDTLATTTFAVLIQEFGLTKDVITAWLLFALDYDIVAMQSATVEVEYDYIYTDDIEVVYGNAPTVKVKDEGGITFKYVA